jgi:hypothetical protein
MINNNPEHSPGFLATAIGMFICYIVVDSVILLTLPAKDRSLGKSL